MDQTLEEARKELFDKLAELEAIECPCCQQNAKVYRRKINSTMARALVSLYNQGGESSAIHCSFLPGREVSQLSWWDLVLDAGDIREDGGRAGYWELTSLGVEFALGEVSVPKFALIYDGEVLSLDESEYVTIQDALGTKFSLEELLSNQ